ncbi:F15O4.25 [Arabidopsis thaliana]|uniref:F15O4.25 n=1 Tax=Arabidopsis thaliana TaxID=3702 RepID=Q9LQG0_ARATH|nr:F15O4.25 [Arabidopsis thaliana]
MFLIDNIKRCGNKYMNSYDIYFHKSRNISIIILLTPPIYFAIFTQKFLEHLML